jgi:hypothetical protein
MVAGVDSGINTYLLLLPPPHRAAAAATEDRLLLSIGDRFSVIATKPDEAVELVWEESEPAAATDAAVVGAAAVTAVTAADADEPTQAQHDVQQVGDRGQPAATRRHWDTQQQSPAAAAPEGAAAAVASTAAAAPAVVGAAAAAPAPPPGNPVMLILSGIPGSGQQQLLNDTVAVSYLEPLILECVVMSCCGTGRAMQGDWQLCFFSSAVTATAAAAAAAAAATSRQEHVCIVSGSCK